MTTFATLSPLLSLHITAAISSVVLGPFALWARMSAKQRPKLHRAFGYAWVTMMVMTAASALFIKSTTTYQINGYSPIHLLIPFTLFSLAEAFLHLAKGNVIAHKKTMQSIYFWACVFTGALTLLPGRLMHTLLFA